MATKVHACPERDAAPAAVSPREREPDAQRGDGQSHELARRHREDREHREWHEPLRVQEPDAEQVRGIANVTGWIAPPALVAVHG